jgi:hypothetical protein
VPFVSNRANTRCHSRVKVPAVSNAARPVRDSSQDKAVRLVLSNPGLPFDAGV